MTLMCRFVALLPDDTPFSGLVESHRDTCLRCQAEAARERGVAREVHTLGSETVRAPEAMQGRVMSRLGAQDSYDPRRPLVIKLVVRHAAAVLAATATVAAVLAGLLRRRSPVS
ncbi:MAG: hypothetical protein R3246_09900 [Acidimicrobiia bacterium]|nr:hypothetical protein [Acidimicrobiia bacterium]